MENRCYLELESDYIFASIIYDKQMLIKIGDIWEYEKYENLTYHTIEIPFLVWKIVLRNAHGRT